MRTTKPVVLWRLLLSAALAATLLVGAQASAFANEDPEVDGASSQNPNCVIVITWVNGDPQAERRCV